MRPDPARSRVERRQRLAGCPAGYSAIEVLFVAALLTVLAGLAIPLVLSSLDSSRTRGAARYLAGRLNLVRMEAVKRSVHVALRVEGAASGYRYTFFTDGNRNGVLSADIASGIDKPSGPPERLDERFFGVTFGVVGGVTDIESGAALDPAGDPVRFGRSDLVSFSPMGTVTPGTFYIRGRRGDQMAVRVLGTTGRVRVLRFDFPTRRWVQQ